MEHLSQFRVHCGGPHGASGAMMRAQCSPADAEERASTFRLRCLAPQAQRSLRLLSAGSGPSWERTHGSMEPSAHSYWRAPCRALPQPHSSGKGRKRRTNGGGTMGEILLMVLRDLGAHPQLTPGLKAQQGKRVPHVPFHQRELCLAPMSEVSYFMGC